MEGWVGSNTNIREGSAEERYVNMCFFGLGFNEIWRNPTVDMYFTDVIYGPVIFFFFKIYGS